MSACVPVERVARRCGPRTSRHARLALATALLGMLGTTQAQAQSADDAELMAGVLARVLVFTRWPAPAGGSNSALRVCVSRGDPLADALRRQASPPRPLDVVDGAHTAADACQVRLLARDTPAAASKPGELIVAQGVGRLESGAMLSLHVEQRRVVFDIAHDSAQAAGIVFDSQVLRLARYVRRSP